MEQNLQKEMENLSIKEQHPQEIPENWTPTLRYLPGVNWEGIDETTKNKYDDSDCLQWTNICVDDAHIYFLTSTLKMAAGNAIGEYTGHVVKFPKKQNMENHRYFVKYFEDDEFSYYIDATEVGNQTRFIRRTQKKEEANVTFIRVWLEGRLRVFLEITKELNPDDEIVVEGPPVEVQPQNNKDPNDYQFTMHLNWDKVQPADYHRFHNRSLFELCAIQKIHKQGHPCDGQLGLLAKRDFYPGEYLGEYTGKVLMNAVFPEGVISIYLMDYSTGYNPELGTVWIDAQDEGNEMRFINDFRNIEPEPNVQFKKMWLDYRLRVFIQVMKVIPKGTEFLADYGESYWTTLKELTANLKK